MASEDSDRLDTVTAPNLSDSSLSQSPALWPVPHPTFAVYAFGEGSIQFGWKQDGYEIIHISLSTCLETGCRQRSS
jgi:hypothetical protein